MSGHLIDIISFGSVFLIMAAYSFLVYRHKERNKEFDWKKRISPSTPLPVDEVVTSSTLLKDQNFSEQYFKSKLVRIEGLREWLLHGGISMSPSVFLAIFALVGLICGSIFHFILHLSVVTSFLLGVGLSLMIPGFWCFILQVDKKISF